MKKDAAGKPEGARAPDAAPAIEDIVARYVDRLNEGERLTPERILAEEPDLGAEIIEDLKTFQELEAAEVGTGELRTLGDYTLRRQIGRGGMGVVYEAWQASLDRRVALKILPAGLAADGKTFLRFMREAKTAAQLTHPNIVSVYGMGVESNTPYYSMQYVEGDTIAQIVARLKGAGPAAETPFGDRGSPTFYSALAKAFADVAGGLQHAHAGGVIHRDIKPSNLILDPERRLRILDFGLARLEGQEGLTESCDVIGTLLYMSPEQARRRKVAVDHRTDVYSLGATLYEVLAGKPPLQGRDQQETLSQILERDPVNPRQIDARVPKDLETIALKCLRKDPQDRYGTAEALQQDLERFVRGDRIEARPPTRWEKVAALLRRHRAFVAALAALLLLSSLGAWVGMALIWNEQVKTTNALREVLRLSDVQRLATYRAEAEDLWPCVPGKVPEMEAWLEKARDLAGRLQAHRLALEGLRRQAAAPGEPGLSSERPGRPDRPRDVSPHPDRPGDASLHPEHPDRPGDASLHPEHPDRPQDASLHPERPGDRVVRREAARREKLGRDRELIADAVGRLEKEADTGTPPPRLLELRGSLAKIDAEIESLDGVLAAASRWTFPDPETEWRHEVLAALVQGLEDLSRPEGGLIADVERRLSFARAVHRLSIEDHREEWRRAIASSADPAECPRYAGLELKPQIGLVPLGRDPRSGLWEFAHIQTGEIPRRGEDGSLILGVETCLVLVLVPGGTFTMGAERPGSGVEGTRDGGLAPNLDPNAETNEAPSHRVTLEPYFLSKYEMTQGQWLRVTGTNPSLLGPGEVHGDKHVSLLHPVEQVTREMCHEVLGHLGLALPTEAQWERGARAGTRAVWWTGDERESLRGAANLSDRFCKENGGTADWKYEEWLDDGYVAHAPVGTFAPNPFGLHDVLGNVFEWCGDRFGSYPHPTHPGTGERAIGGSRSWPVRGGSWNFTAVYARSASRAGGPAGTSYRDLGVRPARGIDR